VKNIIHFIFRSWIRVTSKIFFEKILVTGTENLPTDCPVIFACNHPNAFLDSLVMTTVVKRPLHYTARGDFFKSKIAAKLLDFINILPVFRREEGRELMHKNDETFSYCIEVFKRNGAVIIFSEGISENKYDLRPLRKGTARLAFDSWNDSEVGKRLKVIPVAIHYSSWLKICPKVYVEFLKNIEKKEFEGIDEQGILNKNFNDKLKSILSEKCIIIDKSRDSASQNKVIGFSIKNYLNGATYAKKLQNRYNLPDDKIFKSNYKALSDFLIKKNINYIIKPEKSIMRIINLIGWFLVIIPAIIYNFIPYFICKLIVLKGTKGNDFHDSLLYCLLMAFYPIYLAVLFLITYKYINLGAGLLNVFLAAYSAYFYEASKRFIASFFKQKELVTVRHLIKQLFETNND
jgi:1-acyl-sn-glycerol-3-phosphate acyltransferase